jgi:hypothetical protein
VDIVFAGRFDGDIHLYFYDGVEHMNYPKNMGTPTIFMPPMLQTVSATTANVSIGSILAEGHSWRNTGPYSMGWPKNLPGFVEETFAAGDIDNDGRNEFVVLGVDFLTLLDVGNPPQTDRRKRWPMYGYDAQRTGCLDCDEVLTAAGDTPAVSHSNGLAVHPNPFNPATTIEYRVAEAGPVRLSIYDVGGRLVETLVDGEHREPNLYRIRYTATGASGVYFARLDAGGEVITRKLVVVK